ncbi:type VII secretion protein EccCa [Cellulomonas denverensis]|uniref:type VII secretion protein EccCa n=1 Tax=Cellulomonas denverensis TaxID=264297 RepID=UPI001EF24F05|nr:type VII secretion protein EccCa [Cellulomonas denverensis]
MSTPQRSAAPRVPSGVITLEPPPELSTSDGSNSMLTSMLPMLGSIGSIVMVTMTNSGMTGLLTGGMFLVSSLGFVAVNGWRQRSQRAAEVVGARREYLTYLAELRATVRTAARQQRQAGNWRSPAPGTLVFLAEERTRVWERDPGDPDFLQVRVGTCDQPLCVTLAVPELPPMTQLDPVCASAAHRFLLTHQHQPGLPTSIVLSDYARVELTGDEARVRSLARALVTQAAVLHHPEALVVAVVASPRAADQWEWIKWLPHAHSRRQGDAAGPARMVVGSFDELVELLPADLVNRPRFVEGGGPAPHILVVTDGVPRPAQDPVFRGDGVAGVTVLDLPEQWAPLESADTARVAVADGGVSELIDVAEGARPLDPDALSIEEAEAVARRLMPLYSGPAAVEGRGAVQLGLTELLGLPDVRDVSMEVAWRPRHNRDRLRVPIGQDTTGAPLVLDLKESAQQGMGPHGVMIGATGSGKSEVLRTLVLALALTHSPEQLNFVLVDFKGGATFAGMAEMPHVSAIITNLGQELSLVDRFQDALQGEITRRQELLRAAGNFANVGDYEEARLGGRTDLEPLPALLVVVDEFSELLSAKPEFVDSFVNIGRVGRSLYVHLLIASQRLEEGKLRGLDTYLSYRVGLRTFSGAESRAVLGVPDAVDLPRQPGVGYLKVGTDDLAQFRAAYVSGSLAPRLVGASTRSGRSAMARVEPFTVAPVHSRTPDPVEEADPGVLEAAPEGSMFEVAVRQMAGRGPQAHRVWLPPLEVPEPLDRMFGDLVADPQRGLVSPGWRSAGRLRVPIGLVDVPLEQRREPMVVDLSGAAGHVATVGGPLSGKSTVLRSLVCALALTATPQEVQFYVLDFGGGSFTGLQGLPHLSGLATRSETDVVRRMVAEVSSIIDARERYFREQGIDSMDTYRSRREHGTADDGWGDVFLVVDGWSTLRGEFEPVEEQVQAIAARGLSYGVHLMLAASRWMEVRPQVRDLISTRVELRLGDPSDSEIDRKSAANVPAGMPGRGLTPGGLHLLTALPRIDGSGDPSTLAEGVQHLVHQLRAAWTGPAGPRLRLLPERIDLEQVRAQAGSQDRRLLLGVDEAGLAPFGLDPVAEPHLYAFGESDSGKSTLLRGLAAEVQRLYTPEQAKIFVVDYRRALLDEIPPEYLGAYLTSHELAAGGIAELAAFFTSRLPGPDLTADQLRNRSWWQGAEGFILVDDYDLVATSQGNPLTPLVPLLAQAGDLGLHLAVVRHSGGAGRALYDPILQRMSDLGATGILLSGNPEEGQLIGRVKPVAAPPGRVQVVSRERGLFAGHLAYTRSRHGEPG